MRLNRWVWFTSISLHSIPNELHFLSLSNEQTFIGHGKIDSIEVIECNTHNGNQSSFRDISCADAFSATS